MCVVSGASGCGPIEMLRASGILTHCSVRRSDGARGRRSNPPNASWHAGPTSYVTHEGIRAHATPTQSRTYRNTGHIVSILAGCACRYRYRTVSVSDTSSRHGGRSVLNQCSLRRGRHGAELGQPRIAYRLAHEAAVERTRSMCAMLEAYRNRGVGMLSAATIAVAAGFGFVATGSEHRGWLTWFGVLTVLLGFLASLLATGMLLRPYTGAFAVSSKILIENYGDNPAKYPTDDATYRALAMHGDVETSKLSRDVTRRCRWVYGSLVGLVAASAGTVLVWFGAL